MSERHQISNDIATKAGKQILQDGEAANLPWFGLAISCETTIAIVVLAIVRLSGDQQPERFAAELIDTMTEHAHRRVLAMLRGVPYDG